MMDEQQRRYYLDAMGIENWLPRDMSVSDEVIAPAEVVPPEEGAEAVVSAPAMNLNSSHSPGSTGEQHSEVSPAMTGDADIPPWLNEAPPPLDEYSPTIDYADYAEEASAKTDERSLIAGLDWRGLEVKVAECQSCELSGTRSNTVFGVGDREADLMIIGEAPGAEEDRRGEPFVGRAGQLLNTMLQAIGLGRERVFIANILKCRPPDNRDPRAEEALKCEPFLMRQVALVKPKVILAVGRVAAQNLLKSSEAVGRMRGRDYNYNGTPVVVSYHPAYLLRSPEQKAKSWQDLQRAVTLLKG
ncbi:MAG: uracil-DNA glycosylase [Candidatus Sedimenticola sp. (ex Thyasira tokunagai)]